jgi:hypothetical protein
MLYEAAEPILILFSSIESKQWRQIELTTNFVLWRERCRRIFAEKEQIVLQLARETVVEKKSWFPNDRSTP